MKKCDAKLRNGYATGRGRAGRGEKTQKSADRRVKAGRGGRSRTEVHANTNAHEQAQTHSNKYEQLAPQANTCKSGRQGGGNKREEAQLAMGENINRGVLCFISI